MPTVELETLLLESESRLCQLSRLRSRELATAARTGIPPEDHDRRPETDALLADERILTRLEHAYRHASPESGLHRRSALWLSAALRTRLEVESGQRRAKRQVSALVDSYRGAVGHERRGLDALRLVLRRDAQRARRQQAWRALGELAGLVEPFRRQALAGLSACWSPRRGPQPVSFWDQPLSPFQLEWGAVDAAGLAERFLERTAGFAERFLHHAGQALGSRAVRAWDLGYAVYELSRRYEAWFPPADATASLSGGMRACGLPIDGLPLDPLLNPKWLPLRHAGWPPVDWAGYPVPGDSAHDALPATAAARIRPRVALVADYRAGAQLGWVQLATATGAALAVLFGRGGHLAERWSPPGLDPASLIVADLITEPNWLAGQTAMARSEVPGFLAVGCYRSGLLLAVWVRALAAMALSSWVEMSGHGTAGRPSGGGPLARATGVEDAGLLRPLDFASLECPAYRVSLFLHELAAAQIRRYLRREHGRIMGDRRTGEFLVECFWRRGALVPLGDAVRAATGDPLGPEALAAELEATIPN